MVMSCPNSAYHLLLSDEQGVCDHLSQQAGTACWKWMIMFLDVIVQGIGRKDGEEKEYHPNQGICSFMNIFY